MGFYGQEFFWVIPTKICYNVPTAFIVANKGVIMIVRGIKIPKHLEYLSEKALLTLIEIFKGWK